MGEAKGITWLKWGRSEKRFQPQRLSWIALELMASNGKIFASSESKLNRVMESTKSAVEDVHRRVHTHTHDALRLRVDENICIFDLEEGNQHKFLGVLETVRQKQRMSLECAAKEFLRRMSFIWSSLLSDHNRVTASNQFALPVLGYLMWTQQWPVTELKKLDREVRKVIVENGGKHPSG